MVIVLTRYVINVGSNMILIEDKTILHLRMKIGVFTTINYSSIVYNQHLISISLFPPHTKIKYFSAEVLMNDEET